MKKITLFLSILTLAFSVSASSYVDETFNYTAGVLSPNWTAAGTKGTWINDFTVDATPLSYSNSGGIPFLSGVGKSLTCDYQTPYGSTNYYNYKAFNATAVTTGVVYASFLYSPNGSLNSQSNAPLLYLTGTSSTSGVSVYVGKALAPNDAVNFRFGTTRGSSSSADIKWSTTEFTMETFKSGVFFIVLKYDITNQKSYLFVNPVVGTTEEPAADASDATSASPKTSIQMLEVKTNGSTKTVYKISGIRVCSTWAEAVALQSTASPLPAPVVGSASSVTSSGFTANWSPVVNAVGYDVKVYLGANLVSTTNAGGQATNSLAVSGLMSGLTYTYKVIAKGDVTNFADSDPSAASASFTTSDPFASNALNTDFADVSWGEAVTTQPTAGAYPSSSVNGFDLSSAVLYTGTVKGIRGETHTNRIAIDKSTYAGKVTFPTVNSVAQIEIHATAGTAGNGFILKEFNVTTNTWSAIGDTYVYDANSKAAGTDSVYIIPVSRSVPTKFRIENPSNGGIYLLQVITRTTNPALLPKPLAGAATAISATGFTANWTAVPHATGYKVYVYQGTTAIDGSPFTVNDQAVENLAITSLVPETAYSYKVQATGDNSVAYSDSFLSFSSSVTTSTSTGLDNNSEKQILISDGKSITAGAAGTFEIYNLQGAKIYTETNQLKSTPDVPAGMYIVRFTFGSGQQIIQKINLK